MAANPTIIERREFKYLIPSRLTDGIRAAIQPYCEIDPWAAKCPGQRYLIDSIYFDAPDLALFWANDHEKVDRFKLRVRGYPMAPGGPVFFEVKRRFNDVISKSPRQGGSLAVGHDPRRLVGADPGRDLRQGPHGGSSGS
jgi:hypothetical protein